MNNKGKILVALTGNNNALCDDCLSAISGVVPRQTVFRLCNELSQQGVIGRRRSRCGSCDKFKLTNAADSSVPVTPTTNQTSTSPSTVEGRPWYWEGNIQAALVRHLVGSGYSIVSVSDTATREAGKDVVAEKPGTGRLLVSVKGYPDKSRHVQARHWFAGALFDLVLYRDEEPRATLALAFPDGYVTFKNLAKRVTWLRNTLPFNIYWVRSDSSVRIETPSNQLKGSTE